jgi:hypothetical protein
MMTIGSQERSFGDAIIVPMTAITTKKNIATTAVPQADPSGGLAPDTTASDATSTSAKALIADPVDDFSTFWLPVSLPAVDATTGLRGR